LANQY